MKLKEAHKIIESQNRHFWRYKKYKFIHLFINLKSYFSNEYRMNDAYKKLKDILQKAKNGNLDLNSGCLQLLKYRLDDSPMLFRPAKDDRQLGLSKISEKEKDKLPF